VRSLMRMFQLECEGVNEDADRCSLLREVAGYFWQDDEAPDTEHDGRSPSGVVLARLRFEVDVCNRLDDWERELLCRRYGLSGAVRRLTAADNGATPSDSLSGDTQSRSVEIARARTTLHRAYRHLAHTLTTRPDDRVTLATHRADPLAAPWFEQHLRSRPLPYGDDKARRMTIVALEVARQWCAVGGARQDRLWSDLSCWYDYVTRGRPSFRVVNLPRRLWRANAYVGIALDRTMTDSLAPVVAGPRVVPLPASLSGGPLKRAERMTPRLARIASGGAALRAQRIPGAVRMRSFHKCRATSRDTTHRLIWCY